MAVAAQQCKLAADGKTHAGYTGPGSFLIQILFGFITLDWAELKVRRALGRTYIILEPYCTPLQNFASMQCTFVGERRNPYFWAAEEEGR